MIFQPITINILMNMAIRDLEAGHGTPVTPHVNSIEAEWLEQANRLADMFASHLGQSPDQYIDNLPQFPGKPGTYYGRFDIALLVQPPTPELPLKRFIEIIRIGGQSLSQRVLTLDNLGFDSSKVVQDWKKDPGNFVTPETTYAIWVNDGTSYINRNAEFVRSGLAPDERGGTIFDGIALAIHRPDILERRNIILPGSEYGTVFAACLRRWHGAPRGENRYILNASPNFGSLVAGRKIVTSGL